MRYLFLVHCAACNHDIKYMTDDLILTDKRKRCVYCGKSIAVKANILKRLK